MRVCLAAVAIAHGATGRRLFIDQSNPALGQPTMSSSAKQGGEAFLANDGNQKTLFDTTHGGCYESETQASPWWGVDFGHTMPIASVRIWTRTDVDEAEATPLDPLPDLRLSIYIGDSDVWYDNEFCERFIMTRYSESPTVENVDCAGRYLFVVAEGEVRVLSLCEVEVVPKGPKEAETHLLTVAVPFDLTIYGNALSADDEVRVVPASVECGTEAAIEMDHAVLESRAPYGKRNGGDHAKDVWKNLVISHVGYYSVCWCGLESCTTGEAFTQLAAKFIVMGVISTLAGGGTEADGLLAPASGVLGLEAELGSPYAVAADNKHSLLFVSEYSMHRVRVISLISGRIFVACGSGVSGYVGDQGACALAQLNKPAGLAVSTDSSTLYIADSGNHAIRHVSISSLGADTVSGAPVGTFAGTPPEPGDALNTGVGALFGGLNSPSCVFQDTARYVWICDTKNDKIRYIAMDPESVEYGVMNTLIQGSGYAGDGRHTRLTKIRAPTGIFVSSGLTDNTGAVLPSSMVVTESRNHVLRQVFLGASGSSGNVKTLAGNGQQGHEEVLQGFQSYKTNMRMNTPGGVASTDSIAYISDTGNNRLLAVPMLEFVALGCFREDVLDPLIPSIEGSGEFGETDITGHLEGPYEGRFHAIASCARAAISRGYDMFAVRRQGECCAGEETPLRYRIKGASTSCIDGLGSRTDNSVYRIKESGRRISEEGNVVILAGRDNITGMSSDLLPAYQSSVYAPRGLAVDERGNLFIADSGNRRVRVIHSQIGPDYGQIHKCTNGVNCTISVVGNGLSGDDIIAVLPPGETCGTQRAKLQKGFKPNPVAVRRVPGEEASFTRKSFDFGLPHIAKVGQFTICMCPGATPMKSKLADRSEKCSSPMDFTFYAGTLSIVGPDSKNTINGVAGLRFDIALFGIELSYKDRIRIRTYDSCGLSRQELVTNHGHRHDGNHYAVPEDTADRLEEVRDLGNASFSLWEGIRVLEAGHYTVCWCPSSSFAYGDGVANTYCGADDFIVPGASIVVAGPHPGQIVTVKIGFFSEITLFGVGLTFSDRILVVNSTTFCQEADRFDRRFHGSHVPVGPVQSTNVTTSYRVLLTEHVHEGLQVCWCGDVWGCQKGKYVRVATVLQQGLLPESLEGVRATNPGGMHSLELTGIHLPPSARLLRTRKPCGTSMGTFLGAAQMVLGDPVYRLQWVNSIPGPSSMDIARLCICSCLGYGGVEQDTTKCCKTPADYPFEVLMLQANDLGRSTRSSAGGRCRATSTRRCGSRPGPTRAGPRGRRGGSSCGSASPTTTAWIRPSR
jgi:DNA-binding beta-propeller fold protein YncE